MLKDRHKLDKTQKCQDCGRDIDYVFIMSDDRELCRTCAAKRWQKRFAPEEIWEELDYNRKATWESAVVRYKIIRHYTPLKESDLATNVKKYPFLLELTKYRRAHPEIDRIIELANEHEIMPRHIKNMKWLLENIDKFTDQKYVNNLSKKIQLLARISIVFRSYYTGLLKYLYLHNYLTQKQLSSIEKNNERFKKRIAKAALRRNFRFADGPRGPILRENYGK